MIIGGLIGGRGGIGGDRRRGQGGGSEAVSTVQVTANNHAEKMMLVITVILLASRKISWRHAAGPFDFGDVCLFPLGALKTPSIYPF